MKSLILIIFLIFLVYFEPSVVAGNVSDFGFEIVCTVCVEFTFQNIQRLRKLLLRNLVNQQAPKRRASSLRPSINYQNLVRNWLKEFKKAVIPMVDSTSPNVASPKIVWSILFAVSLCRFNFVRFWPFSLHQIIRKCFAKQIVSKRWCFLRSNSSVYVYKEFILKVIVLAKNFDAEHLREFKNITVSPKFYIGKHKSENRKQKNEKMELRNEEASTRIQGGEKSESFAVNLMQRRSVASSEQPFARSTLSTPWIKNAFVVTYWLEQRRDLGVLSNSLRPHSIWSVSGHCVLSELSAAFACLASCHSIVSLCEEKCTVGKFLKAINSKISRITLVSSKHYSMSYMARRGDRLTSPTQHLLYMSVSVVNLHWNFEGNQSNMFSTELQNCFAYFSLGTE